MRTKWEHWYKCTYTHAIMHNILWRKLFYGKKCEVWKYQNSNLSIIKWKIIKFDYFVYYYFWLSTFMKYKPFEFIHKYVVEVSAREQWIWHTFRLPPCSCCGFFSITCCIHCMSCCCCICSNILERAVDTTVCLIQMP